MVVKKVLSAKKKSIAKKAKKPKQEQGSFWKRFRIVPVLFTIVALLILVFILRSVSRGNGEYILHTVERGDVTREVVLSGRVEPVRSADLGFIVSGQVSAVYAEIGEQVSEGDILVSLDGASIAAQQASANAEIASLQATYQEALRGSRNEETDIVRTQLQNTQKDLIAITRQQDILVENAYRSLLNTDLEAVAGDADEAETPPVVSGTYFGEGEGVYHVEVYGSSSLSGYSLRYSGLETGTASVTTSNSTPLGVSGLRLLFSTGQNYGNTDWNVEIPNTHASTYQTSLNNYQAALETRDLSIAQAQQAVTERQADLALDSAGSSPESINAASANIDVARARSREIGTQLDRYTLSAPFDGVITDIDLEKGEIVNSQSVVVSMISDGSYEVIINVPEIDVSRMRAGAMVDITLDAYGEDIVFPARVIRINPADSIIDGVSVYETTLEFLRADSRVITGMTANARVVIDTQLNVTVIPKYLIDSRESDQYVEILAGEDVQSRKILTGLQGSDGMIEILSGLVPGDRVVIPHVDE